MQRGRNRPRCGGQIIDFILCPKGNCGHWNFLSKKVTRSDFCFEKITWDVMRWRGKE